MFRFILLNFFFQTTVAVFSSYTQIMLRNNGFSNTKVGLIIGAGQIASIFFPVLLCMLADRSRRTKTLMYCIMAASVLLFIPVALTGSMMLTLVTFFLCSGLYWTLNPMLDGYQNRMVEGNASRYSTARSAGTFGYVVATLLMGLVGFPDSSDNRSILLAFACVGVLFASALTFAPSDLPSDGAVKSGRTKSFDASWFPRRYYILMFIVGLTRFAHAIPEKLLSSYMTEELGVGGSFTMFYALGAFSEFLMMVVGGRLLEKKRTTPYAFFLIGTGGLIIRLLMYYLFPNVVAFTVAQLFHSVSFGASHIAVAKFTAQNVEKEHFSLAMSFYWAIATNLPQALAVFVSGPIIDGVGYHNLFLIYDALPVIAFILLLVFRKTITGEEN